MEKQVQKRNEGGKYVLASWAAIAVGGTLDVMGFHKCALAVLTIALLGIVYGVNKNFPRSK